MASGVRSGVHISVRSTRRGIDEWHRRRRGARARRRRQTPIVGAQWERRRRPQRPQRERVALRRRSSATSAKSATGGASERSTGGGGRLGRQRQVRAEVALLVDERRTPSAVSALRRVCARAAGRRDAPTSRARRGRPSALERWPQTRLREVHPRGLRVDPVVFAAPASLLIATVLPLTCASSSFPMQKENLIT